MRRGSTATRGTAGEPDASAGVPGGWVGAPRAVDAAIGQDAALAVSDLTDGLGTGGT